MGALFCAFWETWEVFNNNLIDDYLKMSHQYWNLGNNSGTICWQPKQIQVGESDEDLTKYEKRHL